MSHTINYASEYRGQARDKCTLRIASLDLDFLDEIQSWIYDNAADTLRADFSRGSMRGTDFSDQGRYSLSISCAQNKQGMAAKAALIQHFFDSGHRRLDMTPEEEKAHILAAIEAGKAAYQRKKENMEYIISENLENDCVYAYAAKEFWVYDKQACRWYTSGFCREQYERAKQKLPSLTPEDFLEDDNDYNLLDDYEIPCAALDALQEAVKSGKREAAPFEDTNPTDAAADASPCAPGASDALSLQSQSAAADAQQDGGNNDANPTQAAPASPAGAGAATQSLSAADPVSLAADPVPKFDYSGMDIATVDTLHWAERAIRDARRKCIADVAEAVYIVHDQLIRNSDDHNLSDAEGVVRNSDNSKHGNRGEQAFVNWCRFMGISKTTAYQLLQVHNLLSGATPEELRVLENSGTSLLYVASRPSAEPEAVEALKQEQVKTLKEFRALEAQIKAERQAREKAEHDAQRYREDSEKAREAAHTYHCQYEQVNDQRNALLDQQGEYAARVVDAEQRAKEAEERARAAQSGQAQQLADAKKQWQAAAAREKQAAVDAAIEQAHTDARASAAVDVLFDQLENTVAALQAALETLESTDADKAARLRRSLARLLQTLAAQMGVG